MSEASCDLGFDADLVVRAARGELGPDEAVVREHLKRCKTCASRLLAISAGKEIWSELVAEPPAVARVRDARSAARARSRAGGGRRSLGTFLTGAVLGGAVVAASATLWLGRVGPASQGTTLASASASADVAASANAVVASAPSSVSAPVASAAEAPARAAARAFVVKRASASCRSSDLELGPGVTLPDRAIVDVPQGGKLLVAFSLAEAIAEPESGLTVEGPARAVVEGDALGVERGRASVVAGAASTVRTPHVVVVASHGRFAIDADERGTRVTVSSGSVQITTSSGEARDLAVGDQIQVDAGGHVAPAAAPPRAAAAPPALSEPAPPASSPAPRDPSDRWSTAMRALEAGDRPGAERELRRLVAETDATLPLHRRASFTLAEIELARGSPVTARPRLEAIVLGPEEQLAEDAATLLARSYPTPGERAVVWSKYLGTSPPSPRRERALLERVRALVASGADARAVARACDASTPICAEARAIAGLDKPR